MSFAFMPCYFLKACTLFGKSMYAYLLLVMIGGRGGEMRSYES